MRTKLGLTEGSQASMDVQLAQVCAEALHT